MRRILLIVNANAHTVNPHALKVIVRALEAEAQVTQVTTERPGHATRIAADAATSGFNLVVALGGDGTVNEVVNGLAGGPVPLAVLPGGGANVFARSLGISTGPIEATGALLDAMAGPPQRVPLGRIGERYFAVNCGIGLDAAVVERVERRQFAKRFAGDLWFIWSGLRVFFGAYDRRRPHLKLSFDGQERDGLYLAIVQNTDPYTYLGDRPIRPCATATLKGGLGVMALDSMRAGTFAKVAASAVGSGRRVKSRHAVCLEDVSLLDFESDVPLAIQVDGEFVGEMSEGRIELVPDALGLLLP